MTASDREEWLPPGATARLGEARIFEAGITRELRCLPDGDRILLVPGSRRIHLWSLSGARFLRALSVPMQSPSDWVTEVAVSPTSARVASARARSDA